MLSPESGRCCWLQQSFLGPDSLGTMPRLAQRTGDGSIIWTFGFAQGYEGEQLGQERRAGAGLAVESDKQEVALYYPSLQAKLSLRLISVATWWASEPRRDEVGRDRKSWPGPNGEAPYDMPEERVWT